MYALVHIIIIIIITVSDNIATIEAIKAAVLVTFATLNCCLYVIDAFIIGGLSA